MDAVTTRTVPKTPTTARPARTVSAIGCAQHSKAAPAALRAQARIDTPLGPMTAAATARGLAGLWFDGQRHHPGPLAAPTDDDDPFIAAARRELAAWFAGDAAVRRRGFAVPLDPQGTAFQRAVWQQLLAIGCGERARYGEIARRLGRPEAARAVGAAVGRNPISIIVPCHRVIGHDGALTGYAGGLPRKEALLALESERVERIECIERIERIEGAQA